MKQFKTISHIRTYQIGQFFFEKIGLEDTFPKEKPDEECIKELMERIEKMARVAYPSLFQESAALYSLSNGGLTRVAETITSQPLSVGEEALINCKSIPDLEKYLDLIDKVKDKEEKRKLFLAYDNKFAELSNTGK
jgi:hypothetical protein